MAHNIFNQADIDKTKLVPNIGEIDTRLDKFIIERFEGDSTDPDKDNLVKKQTLSKDTDQSLLNKQTVHDFTTGAENEKDQIISFTSNNDSINILVEDDPASPDITINLDTVVPVFEQSVPVPEPDRSYTLVAFTDAAGAHTYEWDKVVPHLRSISYSGGTIQAQFGQAVGQTNLPIVLDPIESDALFIASTNHPNIQARWDRTTGTFSYEVFQTDADYSLYITPGTYSIEFTDIFTGLSVMIPIEVTAIPVTTYNITGPARIYTDDPIHYWDVSSDPGFTSDVTTLDSSPNFILTDNSPSIPDTWTVHLADQTIPSTGETFIIKAIGISGTTGLSTSFGPIEVIEPTVSVQVTGSAGTETYDASAPVPINWTLSRFPLSSSDYFTFSGDSGAFDIVDNADGTYSIAPNATYLLADTFAPIILYFSAEKYGLMGSVQYTVINSGTAPVPITSIISQLSAISLDHANPAAVQTNQVLVGPSDHTEPVNYNIVHSGLVTFEGESSILGVQARTFNASSVAIYDWSHSPGLYDIGISFHQDIIDYLTDPTWDVTPPAVISNSYQDLVTIRNQDGTIYQQFTVGVV